jgi:outer membrane protein OmpA-like peptidoglycan-associated protein
MDIYVSRKNGKNEWGAPLNIGKPITTPESETFPSISPDGKKLFYTLTTTQGKEKCSKIMMSEQDEKGNWQKPVEAASPLNASCDKSPKVAYDNKTLIYASNKAGNYDLFRTELTASNTWSTPVGLDYVNSGESETNGVFPFTEDFIYYSYKGDIYSAPVPDNQRLHGLGLEGKFVDAETGKPVTGKIFLVDTLAKDTLRRINASGSYKLNIPAGKSYTLVAIAPSYYNYIEKYVVSLDEPYKQQKQDIKIKPKKKEVVFNVAGKDNKGLKVKIKVTNTETKEETIIDAGSGTDGKYAVSLREGNKYNVEINSIEGYAFSSTTIDVPVSEGDVYAANTAVQDTTVASDAVVPNFKIQMQELQDNTKLTLNDIHFLFGKHELDQVSHDELEKVVGLMKSNKSAVVEISAHTDDVGSDDYNNTLSSKRAQEIVKYLTGRGVPASRLRAKGYGKTRPLDTANTEEARAKNRRVELKILDIK